MSNLKKSVLNLIENACEILKDSKVFTEIIINGDKTNITIKKPKEDERTE